MPDKNPAHIIKKTIHDGWSFSETGKNDWKKAVVPGNIHSDLLSGGLIPDPFFGTNEREMQWVGEKDWTWKTIFRPDAGQLMAENITLNFMGLDTFADVFLNGKKILSANNMFRTYQVDVKAVLISGDNELEVRIRNVFDETLPLWKEAPFRLMAFPNNDQAEIMVSMYARKAPFHFGWDWGPRLVTAGIWRPVELQSWSGLNISDIHVIPENLTAGKATIRTCLFFDSTINLNVRAVITLDGETMLNETMDVVPGRHQIEFVFDVLNPELWWTNGLGNPHLYDYEITLSDGDRLIDSRQLKTGIRSIELLRNEDEHGRDFRILLNGIPVFMKGANYIPQDNLQNRVTRSHYETLLGAAAEANMNMLRVWGGGIYEEDDFYEVADELGILIWQDMMFSCSMYPADEEFLENVSFEIADNIKRIRNHPSVAFYCGNNENELGWYFSGWKQLYSEEVQQLYERDLHTLFYRVIPEAINEADPSRAYIPTSPVAGFEGHPSSTGDVHYWGVWHGHEPFETYNDQIGRFMSEYGFQSYPGPQSVARFTGPADRHLHSDVMLSHQRCMGNDGKDREYGNRLIQTYMDRDYHPPKDFETYLYVSQVLQAEGMREAISAHRRNMPYTMGSLYWQLNDCWPAASWSGIDYYGTWKALHYRARDLFSAVNIIPVADGANLQISVVSDKLEPIEARMQIAVWGINTGRKHRMEFRVTIPPNSVTVVREMPIRILIRDEDPADVVLEFNLFEVKGNEIVPDGDSEVKDKVKVETGTETEIETETKTKTKTKTDADTGSVAGFESVTGPEPETATGPATGSGTRPGPEPETGPETGLEIATGHATGSESGNVTVTGSGTVNTVAPRNILYLTKPKELNLKKPRIRKEILHEKGKTLIRLTTDVLARNIFLSADGEDVRLSDNFFDLLPGETGTVVVEKGKVTSENLALLTLADSWLCESEL